MIYTDEVTLLFVRSFDGWGGMSTVQPTPDDLYDFLEAAEDHFGWDPLPAEYFALRVDETRITIYKKESA